MFGFSFKANHQMTSLMPVKGNQLAEPSGKDFLPLENLQKENKTNLAFYFEITCGSLTDTTKNSLDQVGNT